ncbi:MAG: LamG domain-containing protein [Saprospiraceae bacterium]|nr:LamG domain-containing protein [Saprospiraceae bacterium]
MSQMVVYPDSVRLYANGEPWTYKGNFKNFDLSSTSWVIGNGVPGQCGDFNGQMDELKMYNRALTRDEIRLNMHLISKEKENGLVAYYQFNEKDDRLFYDKIETSHMENGNGAHPISSAPVATGVSQKLNSLNQGKIYLIKQE